MIQDPEKIRRRVARMDTDDLMIWANSAAAGMQQQLDDFRKHPAEDHLGEIKRATITMDFVVDELAIRLKQANEALDDDEHPE